MLWHKYPVNMAPTLIMAPPFWGLQNIQYFIFILFSPTTDVKMGMKMSISMILIKAASQKLPYLEGIRYFESHSCTVQF